MGMDVVKSKELLEEAKRQLMLSENADGRGTWPDASRKIFVASAAVNAVKLAKEAANVITKK